MGGGKGTSTSTQAPPKEIMDAYKQSLDLGRQAIQQPYQQYQGQLVAGMNPTQLQGMANVNAAQGVALPYIQQGAAYTNQAAQGVNPQMINQFMSPYLNNVVGATQKNLLESNAQQLAGLKGQAIQSGAFGGDRSRFAQAELARQQGLAGGQVIGGLLNQGFGQAMAGAQQNIGNMLQGGQQLGAMGQAAQQSILQGAQSQMAAGAQQQATEQTFLQSAYDQFLQRQAYPYQQAQFFANIAQGIGAGAGGTTSQTPAAPNPFSQALGLVTAIGSFGASDERIKENIKPVGKTNDGQTIYKYNFKGSPKTEIGLIAQEVEKKNPDAVADFGGIKMVDYDAATEGSERTGKAFGGSSMGGLVTPDMQRQAFAQGGFGMVPYADYFKGLSYVPSGELAYRGHSPGSTFPKGYSPEELEKIAQGSDFDELNAMSAKDIGKFQEGLGNIGKKMGLSPINDGADGLRAPTYSGPLSSFGPGVTNFFSGVGTALGFADGGGVVPRHGYQTDGAVRDESALPPFLVKAESGGDFAADNELGYVGRGQFGEARLTDAKRAGVLPPDVTIDQFKADPGLQKAVENWHVQDVNNFIQNRGLGSFVGKEIGGVPVTEQGLLAVAHLGGKGGMEKFVKSGGRYNPADANGTSLMDYLALAANADGGVVPSTQDVADVEMPPSGVVPASADAPTSDEAPTRRRNIIESILGQDMSDQARTGMLAAGLAMLGGRSPYAGVNIGKGGLAGLQAYYTGLANQRETGKVGEELRLRGVEADTSRMQVENQRLAQARELYAALLPQIRLLTAKGLPLPAYVQAVIDAAFPEGNAPHKTEKTGTDGSTPLLGVPEPGSAALIDDVRPPPPGAAPAVIGNGADQPTAPATTGEAPTVMTPPVSSEQASIFNTLPDEQNPLYWFNMAKNAVTPDDIVKFSERGTSLLETYLKDGYVDASGTQRPLPGAPEAAALMAEAEEAGKLAGQQKNEILGKAYKYMDNYPTAIVALNQAADILQRFETGSLATTKGEISGFLASIGVPVSEADLAAASDAQAFTKLMVGGLLDSGLREKFGQVAVGELELAMKSTGNPNTQPSANRSIIGTMRGVAQWQYDMAKDMQNYVDQKGGETKVTARELRQWQAKNWNDKLADYVEKSKASLPVEGELKIADDGRLETTSGRSPKKGYQYIVPNSGMVVVFDGENFVEAR